MGKHSSGQSPRVGRCPLPFASPFSSQVNLWVKDYSSVWGGWYLPDEMVLCIVRHYKSVRYCHFKSWLIFCYTMFLTQLNASWFRLVLKLPFSSFVLNFHERYIFLFSKYLHDLFPHCSPMVLRKAYPDHLI